MSTHTPTPTRYADTTTPRPETATPDRATAGAPMTFSPHNRLSIPRMFDAPDSGRGE